MNVNQNYAGQVKASPIHEVGKGTDNYLQILVDTDLVMILTYLIQSKPH